MTSHYSMIIRWSDEDRAFVVTIPEFGSFCKTHGDTYEEAVRNGQDVIEMLIETYAAENRPLPAPQTFAADAVA